MYFNAGISQFLLKALLLLQFFFFFFYLIDGIQSAVVRGEEFQCVPVKTCHASSFRLLKHSQGLPAVPLVLITKQKKCLCVCVADVTDVCSRECHRSFEPLMPFG